MKSNTLILLIVTILIFGILIEPVQAAWYTGPDYDGDGHSNEEEKFCGTNHEDAKSKPSKGDPCINEFEVTKREEYSKKGGPILGPAIGMAGESFGMSGMHFFGAILLAILVGAIIFFLSDTAMSRMGGGI